MNRLPLSSTWVGFDVAVGAEPLAGDRREGSALGEVKIAQFCMAFSTCSLLIFMDTNALKLSKFSAHIHSYLTVLEFARENKRF